MGWKDFFRNDQSAKWTLICYATLCAVAVGAYASTLIR